jgi:hypothetical protein
MKTNYSTRLPNLQGKERGSEPRGVADSQTPTLRLSLLTNSLTTTCSVRLCFSHPSNRNIHSAATKPKGKGLLRRPIHTWEDNIKIDLEDTGYEDMSWIRMDWDRIL